MSIVTQKIITRFWSKVKKSDTCWLWTGAHAGRWHYGSFWYSDRRVYAHRFSYELHYGPIPDRLLVCHHCDTPTCVRPDHLFLGTHIDNLHDAVRKGRMPHIKEIPAIPWAERAYARHGKRGQPSGERNTAAKLTDADVSEIRRLRATRQMKHKELAAIFNVSDSQIQRILAGENWKR